MSTPLSPLDPAPRRARAILVVGLVPCALLAAVPDGTSAQTPDRSIAGVITDETGRALANAIVALDPGAATVTVRTNLDGRFRFPRVSQGRHVVAVTWIGHAPESRVVEVFDTRVDLPISLKRLPTFLPEINITSRRAGVWGIVVSREDMRPLAGADVSATGTTATGTALADTTDADGHFELPGMRTGGFVVLTKRPGFQPLFRSVTYRNLTSWRFG